MTSAGPERVFVGLGSNLGDRLGWLRAGVAGLLEAGLAPLAASSVIETPPWGRTDQGAFLNAVVELPPGLAPLDLLALLRRIEDRCGRQRIVRWGPRTLDLDLLLYGTRRLDHPELILPHPRLHERAFVLTSLAELAPALPLQAAGETRSVSSWLNGLPPLDASVLGPLQAPRPGCRPR